MFGLRRKNSKAKSKIRDDDKNVGPVWLGFVGDLPRLIADQKEIDVDIPSSVLEHFTCDELRVHTDKLFRHYWYYVRNDGLRHSIDKGQAKIDHTLKCWPTFFEAISKHEKKHDVRRNTDRTFKVGDVIRLEEFDPGTNSFTGNTQLVVVTYITDAERPCELSKQWVNSGFCILSYEVLKTDYIEEHNLMKYIIANGYSASLQQDKRNRIFFHFKRKW